MLYIQRQKNTIESQAEEFWDWCINVRNYTNATMVHYKEDIQLFIRSGISNDGKKITNQQIDQFMSLLKTGKLTGMVNVGVSINSRVKTIKSFLRWLRDEKEEKIKCKLHAITRMEEADPRRKSFSRDEIERVIQLATLKEKLMVLIMFDSGARISELQKLHTSQIVKYGDTVAFNIIGKKRKRGFLHLTEATSKLLWQYLTKYGITGYIFTSKRSYGQPYRVTSLRRILGSLFSRAGVEDFNPHDLRRSFAVDVYNTSNYDIYLTSKLLRHSDIRTTQIYLTGLDNSISERYQAIKKPLTF
ncbi:MAG: site-specific integrase [Candidatus Nomurabacteria bacterium]|jgi:integrase|nr:site-specific integrase [Candidatus Nomurabacteria bacterium]